MQKMIYLAMVGKSNAAISELGKYNFRSRRELGSCRTFEGKSLADIKNSIESISRKAEETGNSVSS